MSLSFRQCLLIFFYYSIEYGSDKLEYYLRQRTVDGELIPIAQSLGLAVTPWSPLNTEC